MPWGDHLAQQGAAAVNRGNRPFDKGQEARMLLSRLRIAMFAVLLLTSSFVGSALAQLPDSTNGNLAYVGYFWTIRAIRSG